MALSFENARALILSKVAPLPAVSVPLIDSVGRVAAAEVRALRDVPDWDNSEVRRVGPAQQKFVQQLKEHCSGASWMRSILTLR